jgi:osmoprotectant transport system ATP-binding protein
MGDRIAVFSEGGHLEQYDAPPRLLGAPATEFVASFVGSDRGLKRLSVTPITARDLEHPPIVHGDDRVADATAALRKAGARWGVVLDEHDALHGWLSADDVGDLVMDRAKRMEAWLPTGSSLKAAFAEMLQHDAGWVAVLDGDRYVGVLTPATLHEALRRSVESDVLGVEPDAVELDRVPTV